MRRNHSSASDRFFDPAARAGQRVMGGIRPTRKWQSVWQISPPGYILVEDGFTVFGAAVFAEPTVTKIEEVV